MPLINRSIPNLAGGVSAATRDIAIREPGATEQINGLSNVVEGLKEETSYRA